ncbi:MAG: Nramp family divalent metal transporter [Nitrospirae bacterium]|nr:Nramp family divalent metal transporter [Nitrospirota bacterium]MBF0541323.1 Nramp family divalent metal transporter [Nitrospirota bacterium]
MKTFKRLAVYLSLFGPGLITAMIDNDAGGITTCSVSGARYGYNLLWTIIPITISLIVVQEMVARLGIVTGKGLADLIRENYGIKNTFFLMVGLFIANLGTTVADFAGFAASMEILGISKYLIVPLGTAVIWLLISKGSYKFVEKVLLSACIIFFGYIIAGIMAKPDWHQVVHNTFIPHIKFESEYLMLVIAIIGTTITPWMQFYYQSSIIEKGLKTIHLNVTKMEIILGSIATNLISIFIIITCAAVLFPKGIRINEASEVSIALEPFAGEYAKIIFAVSLANASILGAIIVPLASAYYICEAMGWESGVDKTYSVAPQFIWIYSISIFVSALLVMIPGAPLVLLMVLSSFANGILLPFVLVYAISLVNNKTLMGEYTNSRGYNIIAWVTIGVLIVLSIGMVFSLYLQ